MTLLPCHMEQVKLSFKSIWNNLQGQKTPKVEAEKPRFTTQLSQDHLNVQKPVMKSSGHFPIVWWMEESRKALWAIEMFFSSADIFPFAFDHFERSGTLPAWIETLVLVSCSLGFGVLFSINQRVCRHYPKETFFSSFFRFCCFLCGIARALKSADASGRDGKV